MAAARYRPTSIIVAALAVIAMGAAAAIVFGGEFPIPRTTWEITK